MMTGLTDMGERIAGKQDKSSLILEAPQAHRMAKIFACFTFWPIY